LILWILPSGYLLLFWVGVVTPIIAKVPRWYPPSVKFQVQNSGINKNTGEVWEKSHTNHSGSEGGEWKVGIKKGQPPSPRNKITVSSKGRILKFK
jgi:hypothetical protein